jgi:two-component system, response regulator
MNNGAILLVEDNPDDEALTLRALKKNNISNEVVVAHDGVEAVEILLGNGNGHPPPAIVLLDLKLPRMDGLEVLRRVRADPRMRLLPVVILTTSKEEQDLINGYKRIATSANRWTLRSLRKPCASWGCTGWC